MAISCGTSPFASGRRASSSAAQPRATGDQSPSAVTRSSVAIVVRSRSKRPEATASATSPSSSQCDSSASRPVRQMARSGSA